MNTEILFSSKTDQWTTPQWLFDELDEEFRFTLDPCADATNHKCDKYFTKEQDGLSQDWGGETVFCNPPYGKEIVLWAKKCREEVEIGTCPCVVMLVPARTDTKWFHDWVYRKAELRFVKGRIRFGDSKYNAPFPSMIAIFKKEANA